MNRIKMKKNIRTTPCSLNDLPIEEVKKLMAEYASRHSRSVRSSRSYLRKMGMEIDSKGVWTVNMEEARISYGPRLL